MQSRLRHLPLLPSPLSISSLLAKANIAPIGFDPILQEVRAVKDIGEGEEILANYIDSWEGSFLDHAQRQVNSLPFQSNVYRM